MSKVIHQCQANVMSGYHTHQCMNTAKVERKEKWYCGIHDPVAIRQKDRARRDKFDKKWSIKNAQWGIKDIKNNIADEAIRFINSNGKMMELAPLAELVAKYKTAVKNLEILKNG